MRFWTSFGKKGMLRTRHQWPRRYKTIAFTLQTPLASESYRFPSCKLPITTHRTYLTNAQSGDPIPDFAKRADHRFCRAGHIWPHELRRLREGIRAGVFSAEIGHHRYRTVAANSGNTDHYLFASPAPDHFFRHTALSRLVSGRSHDASRDNASKRQRVVDPGWLSSKACYRALSRLARRPVGRHIGLVLSKCRLPCHRPVDRRIHFAMLDRRVALHLSPARRSTDHKAGRSCNSLRCGRDPATSQRYGRVQSGHERFPVSACKFTGRSRSGAVQGHYFPCAVVLVPSADQYPIYCCVVRTRKSNGPSL